MFLNVSACPQGGSTWTGIPLGRYPPSRQVHHLGRYTPREQCMLGDTGNKRTVRILLECILVMGLRRND